MKKKRNKIVVCDCVKHNIRDMSFGFAEVGQGQLVDVVGLSGLIL